MASFSNPDESSHTMIRKLATMLEVGRNKYPKPELEPKVQSIQQSAKNKNKLN